MSEEVKDADTLEGGAGGAPTPPPVTESTTSQDQAPPPLTSDESDAHDSAMKSDSVEPPPASPPMPSDTPSPETGAAAPAPSGLQPGQARQYDDGTGWEVCLPSGKVVALNTDYHAPVRHDEDGTVSLKQPVEVGNFFGYLHHGVWRDESAQPAQ